MSEDTSSYDDDHLMASVDEDGSEFDEEDDELDEGDIDGGVLVDEDGNEITVNGATIFTLLRRFLMRG